MKEERETGREEEGRKRGREVWGEGGENELIVFCA